MVEGPIGGSGIFPGIAPAAINEISELFAELGKPTQVRETWKYNTKGLPTQHNVTTVTKLDLLIILGGPTFLALFYVLMERLASMGGDLSSAEKADLVLKGPLGLLLDKKKQELAGAALEDAGNALGSLWTRFTGLGGDLNPFD